MKLKIPGTSRVQFQLLVPLFSGLICCGLVFSQAGCESTTSRGSSNSSGDETVEAEHFLSLIESDSTKALEALGLIEENWQPGYAIILVDAQRYVTNRGISMKLIQVLEAKTGQDYGTSTKTWYTHLWNQPYEPHPDFASIKSSIFSKIDGRFAEYFEKTDNAKIRLDEIRFGGVVRDGIPPLKEPTMLKAGEADFMEDSNVVFGVVLNGDARAYPKRILAWHEMFKDVIGGQSVCGVY